MKTSRRGRVTLATLIWIAVGVMLIWRGVVPFLGQIDSTTGKALALGLGAVVGIAKGMFVLSKSARRTAGYIARRPEQDWVFLCLHPILWAVIPVMIGMGLGLKALFAEGQPGIIVGVYVGIGAAMIVGSRGFRTATSEPAPAMA